MRRKWVPTPKFVDSMDKAGRFAAPVQCGECYMFYDATLHTLCPCCHSPVMVGSR